MHRRLVFIRQYLGTNATSTLRYKAGRVCLHYGQPGSRVITIIWVSLAISLLTSVIQIAHHSDRPSRSLP